MNNRRKRLRTARLLTEAKTLRRKIVREWRWLIRDLRDAKGDLKVALRREPHG